MGKNLYHANSAYSSSKSEIILTPLAHIKMGFPKEEELSLHKLMLLRMCVLRMTENRYIQGHSVKVS